MGWLDRRWGRRIAPVAVVSMVAALSGCGIQEVYEPYSVRIANDTDKPMANVTAMVDGRAVSFGMIKAYGRAWRPVKVRGGMSVPFTIQWADGVKQKRRFDVDGHGVVPVELWICGRGMQEQTAYGLDPDRGGSGGPDGMWIGNDSAEPVRVWVSLSPGRLHDEYRLEPYATCNVIFDTGIVGRHVVSFTLRWANGKTVKRSIPFTARANEALYFIIRPHGAIVRG